MQLFEKQHHQSCSILFNRKCTKKFYAHEQTRYEKRFMFVTIKHQNGICVGIHDATQSSELDIYYQDVSALTNAFVGDLSTLVDFVLCNKKQAKKQEKESNKLKKEPALKNISKKAKNKNINIVFKNEAGDPNNPSKKAGLTPLI